jgi:hypothetical protein
MAFLRNARPLPPMIKGRQDAPSMPDKSDLRNARPRRSMFTRRDATTSMPEKSCESLNDSDRTGCMTLDDEEDTLNDCSLDESSRSILDLQYQTELINAMCDSIEEQIRALKLADLNKTRARPLKLADLNKTRRS